MEQARVAIGFGGNITTAQTDEEGRFTVVFPGDEGDYFVDVDLGSRAGGSK